MLNALGLTRGADLFARSQIESMEKKMTPRNDPSMGTMRTKYAHPMLISPSAQLIALSIEKVNKKKR